MLLLHSASSHWRQHGDVGHAAEVDEYAHAVTACEQRPVCVRYQRRALAARGTVSAAEVRDDVAARARCEQRRVEGLQRQRRRVVQRLAVRPNGSDACEIEAGCCGGSVARLCVRLADIMRQLAQCA
jgi:hypothetical protein